MSDYTFPVLFDGARISSGIGPRTAPTAGASSNHRGVDIAAPAGSAVLAPTDLTITHAQSMRGYGETIYGTDQWGQQHRFAHLSGYSVQPGMTVPQGAQIGAVGATGTATGAHLHYEVRDKAGKLLADTTNAVVNAGKKLASSELGKVIFSVLKSNPATAPFAIGADIGADILGIGGGDGCGINPICHLRKWLEETAFVQRSALYFLGTLFIIGGIAFLALGFKPTDLAKAATKGLGK